MEWNEISNGSALQGKDPNGTTHFEVVNDMSY